VKYFVTVDGEDHEVEVVERLGRMEVRYDGDEVDVSHEEVDRLGQVALFLEHRSHAVSIEGTDDDCVVTVAGHVYAIRIEDERERAARAAERASGRGGGEVISVMPGVVVSLLVAEGEAVEEGQALLVLEAMKMQNEIVAPSAGVVERLLVREGEAVSGGVRLCLVRTAPSPGDGG